MPTNQDPAAFEKLQAFLKASLNAFIEIERENANYRHTIRVLQGKAPKSQEKRRLVTWIAHTDAGFIEGMQQIAPQLLLDIQSVVQTGGEVMDSLSRREPDLVLLGDDFDDIPSDFVFDTIRSQAPRCAFLRVYGWPVGDRHGLLDGPYEEAQIDRTLESGHDLVALLDEARQRFDDLELRQEFGRAFRDRHDNWLRSYKAINDLVESLAGRR